MTGRVTGTKIKYHRIPRYYTKSPAVKCSPHMLDEGVGAQSARVVSTNRRHTLRHFASTLNVCRDTFVFGFVSTHPRTIHVFIMLGQNWGWMGGGCVPRYDLFHMPYVPYSHEYMAQCRPDRGLQSCSL